MSKTVEFFFDFGSPTSYLAWTQIPRLCAELGAELIYKPMLLGAVFQATGNASPAMIPSKGRYMFRDMARFARRYGVSLQFNPHFPINTLTLMRAAVGIKLREPERFAAFVMAIFHGMWVDALNMGDPAVAGAVLAAAGFNAAAVLALATEPEVKEALKSNTDEAIGRGVFGAPSIFVGDELFFGQDRLDFVREALLVDR